MNVRAFWQKTESPQLDPSAVILRAHSLSSALSLCSNANIYSWKGRCKLFDSIVTNSLLYAAPIWSLRYLEDIEIIQSTFLKRSLYLPQSTTNYVLRCETGTVPLKFFVFNNLMQFWLKLLQLDNTRLTRICYNRLVQLHKPGLTGSNYNWASLVRHLLEDIGYSHVWTSQDPIIVKNKLTEMCLAFKSKCIDLDDSSLITSTSNPLYFLSWKKWMTANYLLHHIPFSMKALVAQIRLNARKFYFKGSSLQLVGDQSGKSILYSGLGI